MILGVLGFLVGTKLLSKTILKIIKNVISKLLEGFIEYVVNTILDFTVKLVSLCSKFFIDMSAYIYKIDFIQLLIDKIRLIAMAIFIIVVAYQIIKSMFSYLGFESDEPWKIGARAIIFGFLTYYAEYVCVEVMKLFTRFLYGTTILLDYNTWELLSDQIKTGLGEQIIVILLSLYTIIKLISLTFRFGERLIMTILLIVASPLAFVAGVSKSTKAFLNGWVRLFAGNLMIQLMQVSMLYIFLMICKEQYSQDISGLTSMVKQLPFDIDAASFIPMALVSLKFFLLISTATVLEKVEAILKQISIAVGGEGHPLESTIGFASRMGEISYLVGNLTSMGSRSPSAFDVKPQGK